LGNLVVEGNLLCVQCGERFPIVRSIPRFVSEQEDYAKSFGLQWERFRRTQVDRFNGTDESKQRFLSETGWEWNELKGLLVLDAGCGAGRFTAIACEFGARVVAVDLTSGSAESCYKNMKELGCEAFVVQASLYKLPFRPDTFDRIFSLGVLQHTPEPHRAMELLPAFLKPGGKLAYWIYEKRWYRYLMVRNYLRLITRNLSPRTNWWMSVGLVSALFPLTAILSVIPVLCRAMALMPIAGRHYWGKLSLRQQWEWTLLDTFDSYSAKYEHPQLERDVFTALTRAGMQHIQRTPARGMAIAGVKPASGEV
jgi:2-polyprenyl-3-methyl-5-hydroxy-6-metoxy-1,4-benzoquinol methylase